MPQQGPMARQTAVGEEQRLVPLQAAQDGEGAQRLPGPDGGQRLALQVPGGVHPVAGAVVPLPLQDGVVLPQRVQLLAGEAILAAERLAAGVLLVQREVAGATAVLGKAAGTCKYVALRLVLPSQSLYIMVLRYGPFVVKLDAPDITDSV